MTDKTVPGSRAPAKRQPQSADPHETYVPIVVQKRQPPDATIHMGVGRAILEVLTSATCLVHI